MDSLWVHAKHVLFLLCTTSPGDNYARHKREEILDYTPSHSFSMEKISWVKMQKV
jgi:hypothetical protein